jgi:Tol biopolymer transport system component
VLLVDVENGKARKLGEPLDTSFLSWLPDGAGLVLITRKYPDPDGPSVDTIARMDLTGNVTPIRSGTMPVVLSPYQRILFRDKEDGKWKVCDLNGEVLAVVGDGLRNFVLPAASPDGKRVIMMQQGGSEGPRPQIVDLTTGSTTPINVESGFWSYPTWR